MKQVYWHPPQISRARLTILTLISIAGWLICQWFLVEHQRAFFDEKKQASELTQKAFETVKKVKQTRMLTIDTTSDPLQTGLIGVGRSMVTTDAGSLAAKRTSVNANFSALIVQWLKQIGVQPGQNVAVGMSGSFPALNIAVLSALEILQIKALYIVSTSASQWGANQPELMWPDMLLALQKQGLIKSKPLAMSRGGIGDRAIGLSASGVDLIDACMLRMQCPIIVEEDMTRNLEQRMHYYLTAAGNQPIKAYINIGGGTVSVGAFVGKKIFHPGLNQKQDDDTPVVDSVMQRFADMGVPVIHLVQIKQLAEAAQLPFDPEHNVVVGDGPLFYTWRYSRAMIVSVLSVLLGMMFAFSRIERRNQSASSSQQI